MKEIEELLKMTERPQDYSDEAIREMMNDPNMRAYYELMVSAEAGFSLRKEGHGNHRERSRDSKDHESIPMILRIAAIFIGVLILSGITFAAVHIIRHSTVIQEPQPEERPIKEQTVPTVPTDTINSIVHSEPVLFDNVTLDSIAKDIAAYYQIEMDMQNEQARQLRFYFLWQPNDSLQEVIDKLDMFEQVDMAIEHGKLIVR